MLMHNVFSFWTEALPTRALLHVTGRWYVPNPNCKMTSCRFETINSSFHQEKASSVHLTVRIMKYVTLLYKVDMIYNKNKLNRTWDQSYFLPSLWYLNYLLQNHMIQNQNSSSRLARKQRPIKSKQPSKSRHAQRPLQWHILAFYWTLTLGCKLPGGEKKKNRRTEAVQLEN